MSLSAPVPSRTFRIAILASTSLEDPNLIPSLPALLPENLATVSHIVTNGANELVTKFAANHGIPFSVFPLTGGGNLPHSTALVLDNADLVYVLFDECSKSSSLILDACKKKEIKHKAIKFDPVEYWKLKVCKAREILEGVTKEDLATNVHLQSVRKVLG